MAGVVGGGPSCHWSVEGLSQAATGDGLMVQADRPAWPPSDVCLLRSPCCWAAATAQSGKVEASSRAPMRRQGGVLPTASSDRYEKSKRLPSHRIWLRTTVLWCRRNLRLVICAAALCLCIAVALIVVLVGAPSDGVAQNFLRGRPENDGTPRETAAGGLGCPLRELPISRRRVLTTSPLAPPLSPQLCHHRSILQSTSRGCPLLTLSRLFP